jgi:hypothetical protein
MGIYPSVAGRFLLLTFFRKEITGLFKMKTTDKRVRIVITKMT